jgi:hypothetical protein
MISGGDCGGEGMGYLRAGVWGEALYSDTMVPFAFWAW